MGKANDEIKDEILLAVSISLGALFFATAITLIIARFYKQIRACCQSCCPSKEQDNNNSSGFFFSFKSPTLSRPAIPYTKIAERRKEAANAKASTRHPPVYRSAQDNQFTIPGMFYSSQIQPELKVPATSDGSYSRSSSMSSHPSSSPNRRYTNSATSLPANFSPSVAKRIAIGQSGSITAEDDTDGMDLSVPTSSISMEDMSSFDLKPELYNIARQKTLGIGNLGKLHLSLQYEDKSRKKLNIFLNSLQKLQIIRPDIISIYASVLLLPDRESIFTTKQNEVRTNAAFAEKFIFASRPMNRDFESKTALFLVHYIDKVGKDIIYGEARMPLLCREIYSQVLTDVTLNIKCASMQSEFGDLLVQLIYNDSGSLHVMVKMVKVPSSMSLENMSGLQFKCYLKKFGSRVGRKTSISRTLESSTKLHSVEVNGECKFKISRECFMDHDITCAVSGKHKILGKKLNLGKVVIGNSSKDETGTVHWKTVFMSSGIAWTVWHPIYNV